VVRLQDAPIDVASMTTAIRGDGDGAVALFLGTVRNVNAGRRVLFLEYEAYVAMADGEMARIADEARTRFPISSVDIVHRLGRLAIGDVSVAVAVAAPHRADAIDACRFVIDALKARVPIWKREHFEGGEVWIEGEGGR
jgi:molybdopterin synthase catalytic subunit